eukprot:TRINITY_DN259_c1_g4_i1.p1 TRINITY_DN259_c1_g4~~TRINITY_DN259_c1_g4_i1.p1  ORF type:complete len:264 (+),score=81.33 TRINITY_DN259_c1_g4_i1:60-851(+)
MPRSMISLVLLMAGGAAANMDNATWTNSSASWSSADAQSTYTLSSLGAESAGTAADTFFGMTLEDMEYTVTVEMNFAPTAAIIGAAERGDKEAVLGQVRAGLAMVGSSLQHRDFFVAACRNLPGAAARMEFTLEMNRVCASGGCATGSRRGGAALQASGAQWTADVTVIGSTADEARLFAQDMQEVTPAEQSGNALNFYVADAPPSGGGDDDDDNTVAIVVPIVSAVVLLAAVGVVVVSRRNAQKAEFGDELLVDLPETHETA